MLNQNLLLTGDDGYNLTNSLRFRSSASAYLNRTISSNGSATTFTYSTWVKRGTLGAAQDFGIEARVDGSNNIEMRFDSGDTLSFLAFNGGSFVLNFVTTQVFRDPSAWYHIIIAVDTTQATSTNRVKLYVNGSQITAFSTSTYPSQNATTYMSQTSATHNIGRWPSPTQYFDGYLAEVNFIDGQALTPSSFGETSATTGVWIPKKYTGTYGTNGFYLPFTDVATTSGSNAGLGKDFSGNGNYWTTNNISVTSGSTYDSMTDVPTLTSTTTANYCVLNPLDKNSNITLSNGNLTSIPSSTADYWLCRATMAFPTTGKYYWELTLNNTPLVYLAGIYSANRPLTGETSGTGNEYQVAWGTAYSYIRYQSNNSATANWGTNTNPTSGDVLMFAFDADNSTMWIGRNGTWYNTSGTANPATNTDPRFSSIPSGMFAGVNQANPASGGVSMNFGQQGFAYTPPTGFKALNTFNLPTPTIGATASTQANKYMDATTYTGNGSTLNVVNAGSFAPDLVWTKERSGSGNHMLGDILRGTNNTLFSNNNLQAYTDRGVDSFNSNGFTYSGTEGGDGNVNGSTYVAWQWKANGSGSTNTSGSITSTVSANTSAGFSIVTFTGNSTAGATIGHGLGVAPTMAFVKSRSNSYNWCVYAKAANGGNGQNGGFYLNLTDAWFSDSGFWNNTTASSTVLTLGSGFAVNNSGSTYVAYCFAPVAGYSAFGSYTGNGSSDGTFVYLGFKPAFVLVKRTDSTDNWVTFDNKRDPYNVASNVLLPNLSNAESSSSSSASMDFVSNGFKIRASTGINSGTWIYMAFAENPFKYSLAR